MSSSTVVVTGLGLAAPGVRGTASLLETLESGREPVSVDPPAVLGFRGLRYYDRATLLALCAAKEALLHAGLADAAHARAQSPALGVVVSSNLGNLDTVCKVVRSVRSTSVQDLSPMDLPTASSNVIASTLAIRFGCRGVNLLVCNGATSGIDEIYVAANCIRRGRARRILLVGVEPRHAIGDALLADAFAREGGDPGALEVGEGAAAIVLESSEAAAERQAPAYGRIGGYAHHRGGGDIEHSVGAVLAHDDARFDDLALWLVPNQRLATVRAAIDRVMEAQPVARRCATCDVSARLGELYGALGAFQCAVACLSLARHTARQRHARAVLLTAGGWHDGASSLLVSAVDDE